MTKLEQIRQACINANDDILKLQFGCDTSFGIFIGTISVKQKTVHRFMRKGDYHGNDVSHALSKERGFKILGRPCRLADVLVAIRESKSWGIVKHPADQTDEELNIVLKGRSDLLGRLIQSDCGWNLLKDDVTLQSQPTIDFIHSILFQSDHAR